MIVYRISENGYFNGTEEYPDDAGIPFGSTRTEVPFIPEGSYAIWTGTGWNITDTPPPGQQITAPAVPDVASVSMRQIRRILFQYDMLSQVEIYISSLQSPDKELAQIDWEYATQVSKESEFLQQVFTQLNTDQQTIDRLFYEASLIGE
jgi:hypothetical protein